MSSSPTLRSKEPDLKWLIQNARSILVRNLLSGLCLPHLLPATVLEITTDPGCETEEQVLLHSDVHMESCNPSWTFSGLIASECLVDNLDTTNIVIKVLYAEDRTTTLIEEYINLAKLISLPRALSSSGAEQPLSINFLAINVDDALYISEDIFSSVMGASVTFTGSYLEIAEDPTDADATSRSVALSRSISTSNAKIGQLRESLTAQWDNIKMTKLAVNRENRLTELEELRREVTAAEDELRIEESCLEWEQQQLANFAELQALQDQCNATAAAAVEAEDRLIDKKKSLLQVKFLLEARQVKLLSDLQTLYPIDRIEGSGGEYAIRGIELPTDLTANKDDEQVAAALGYVVHLTLLASKYLEVPLRYQMLFMGSRSFIRDPVLGSTSGTLPLFRRNVEKERFDRAVSWLRRDIEQLLQTRGVLYDHTKESNILYNLHQLFFCEMCPKLAV